MFDLKKLPVIILVSLFAVSTAQAMSCDLATKASLKPEKSKELSQRAQSLVHEIANQVIGQEKVIERIFIALLTEGHVLLEGPPGGGKTTLVKSLAEGISGQFTRTQFTADTQASDLTGSSIFNPATREFEFHKGSLFANVVHADEINRATPRTQSALLEAMEERTVTIGGVTHHLPRVYFIMATQNPGLQIGTFPLPEAQMDRFMFKIPMNYASREVEAKIMEAQLKRKREGSTNHVELKSRFTEDEILAAQRSVFDIELTQEAKDYILNIVDISRNPLKYNRDLHSFIREGISPRGTLSLTLAAQGIAWLRGKSQVEVSDVMEIARETIEHRLLLTDTAITENYTVENLADTILKLAQPRK